MTTDLQRFTDAQKRDFETAFAEISNGRKDTHWMWYIFPQIAGLGKSPTSSYYAIRSLDEARAFLDDPYLGANLVSICQALLTLPPDNATEIFGKPDDKKLRSSMTLFSIAAGDGSIFEKVLEKFFDGKRDRLTTKILGTQ